MKKNILKITFATALAVVAGVTAYQAQDKEICGSRRNGLSGTG